MSRLTELIKRYQQSVDYLAENWDVTTRHMEMGEIRQHREHCQIEDDTLTFLIELQKYKDLEEQGRLIDWRKTSEEKPDSTRHLIVVYGEIISHYAYYLKPKDKWFTDWTCEKELDAPIFWADMPDPPEESLHNDCVAKMDEVENER